MITAFDDPSTGFDGSISFDGQEPTTTDDFGRITRPEARSTVSSPQPRSTVVRTAPRSTVARGDQ